MEKFYRRLFLYLVGVGMGFVLVYFMLINNRERDFAVWLPERRIKESVSTSQVKWEDKALCWISCINNNQNLPDSVFFELINASKVNLKKSEPRNDCPIYHFEDLNINNSSFAIDLTICDSVTTVINVNTEKVCDC